MLVWSRLALGARTAARLSGMSTSAATKMPTTAFGRPTKTDVPNMIKAASGHVQAHQGTCPSVISEALRRMAFQVKCPRLQRARQPHAALLLRRDRYGHDMPR